MIRNAVVRVDDGVLSACNNILLPNKPTANGHRKEIPRWSDRDDKEHMLGVELQIPRVIYISWQTNDSESDSGERDMNHFDVGVETRKRKPGERIKKQIV